MMKKVIKMKEMIWYRKKKDNPKNRQKNNKMNNQSHQHLKMKIQEKLKIIIKLIKMLLLGVDHHKIINLNLND